ncbi:MAG: glutamate 5-kinase [Clostridiales bacterium]|nr:glutamate 5-kinase [Clostridiales bacterium]
MEETRRQQYMKKVKRVVIKVGSSTLTYPNGLLNLERIESLARQIADIHNRGIEVILVSSGAIAAGMGRLGLKRKPKSVVRQQACAAVGQVRLMHMYDKILGEYGKNTAQILITKEDMEDSKRIKHAKNTFQALMKENVIPIVNENDAITIEEIKIGDNDTLSAHVCKFVQGDLLIILSDINGLYDCNPANNEQAKLINYVSSVTEEIASCAEGAGTSLGTGGMVTKLRAANIVNQYGAAMVIVNGAENHIINRVLNGEEVGTFFDCI